MRFIIKNDILIPEPLARSHNEASDQLAKQRQEESSQSFHPLHYFKTIPDISLNESFQYDEALQQILTGKQLLLDEIAFPLSTIQKHYENGYLSYRHGLIYDERKYVCSRCQNDDQSLFANFPCYRCKEDCTYCRNCIMMGRVSTCTPLLTWTGPSPEIKSPEEILAWQGHLSAGQGLASKQVIANISTTINNKNNYASRLDKLESENKTLGETDEKSYEELLVWAVCGSGKTELLFPGIAQALKEKLRVCIATPRTDVVLELTPRLQAAFPHFKIASLYGGSNDRYDYAQLTITTTHQLFRFYKAFDVIILDEVDAFPYTVDKTLRRALQNARKPISSLIYLTATPSRKWQDQCKRGKRPYVTIPARYHRHKLPVPKFVWSGNWAKDLEKGQLPNNILHWLKGRLTKNKQALIFFPDIALMEKALPIFRKLSAKIESVHAADPDRQEKVQAMRKREIEVLLTTTILERGVTFPNIDVAVIGAEERIFTESALVQIAGRVGRSADFPDGDITFFHYGKTQEMVRAKRQIEMMNKLAKEEGLID